jgi:predicted SprT family Zn-dependent metalloprotease
MRVTRPRFRTPVGEIDPGLVATAIGAWERAWDTPGLANGLTVTFSTRLRRTLGRAVPARGAVVLHALLRDAPAERLLEVLCHEVAHIVAFRRARAAGARRAPPHGEAWAALVRAAGYEPATRAARPEGAAPHRPARRAGLRVAHVCPVCHSRRLARRVVPGWRCAACVAVGLEGRLEIVRLPESTR